MEIFILLWGALVAQRSKARASSPMAWVDPGKVRVACGTPLRSEAISFVSWRGYPPPGQSRIRHCILPTDIDGNESRDLKHQTIVVISTVKIIQTHQGGTLLLEAKMRSERRRRRRFPIFTRLPASALLFSTSSEELRDSSKEFWHCNVVFFSTCESNSSKHFQEFPRDRELYLPLSHLKNTNYST